MTSWNIQFHMQTKKIACEKRRSNNNNNDNEKKTLSETVKWNEKKTQQVVHERPLSTLFIIQFFVACYFSFFSIAYLSFD